MLAGSLETPKKPSFLYPAMEAFEGLGGRPDAEAAPVFRFMSLWAALALVASAGEMFWQTVQLAGDLDDIDFSLQVVNTLLF